MRPTLEHGSSIWSPIASSTKINKLQVMQNAALRACTGCTHDTTIQHLHNVTNILPILKHLQLHASQVRQKAQYPSHPLYRYTTYNISQRLMEHTTFNNSRYTTNIPTDPRTVTTTDIKANIRVCPLCRTHKHTTRHLFSCPQINTTLSALDLWRNPTRVAALLDDWREKLPVKPHKAIVTIVYVNIADHSK